MANLEEGSTKPSIRPYSMGIGWVSSKKRRPSSTIGLLGLVRRGSSCTYENLSTEQIQRSQVSAKHFHVR